MIANQYGFELFFEKSNEDDSVFLGRERREIERIYEKAEQVSANTGGVFRCIFPFSGKGGELEPMQGEEDLFWCGDIQKVLVLTIDDDVKAHLARPYIWDDKGNYRYGWTLFEDGKECDVLYHFYNGIEVTTDYDMVIGYVVEEA